MKATTTTSVTTGIHKPTFEIIWASRPTRVGLACCKLLCSEDFFIDTFEFTWIISKQTIKHCLWISDKKF